MKFNRAHLRSGLVLALGMSCLTWLQAQTAQRRAKVAEGIPSYQPMVPVTGSVDLLSIDALAELGIEWSMGFRNFHPEANLIFRPQPTQAAVKAFQEGGAILILSARDLTGEEAQAFQAKYGYPPMRIPVCLDANIVFVNKANPIRSISMEQLDAVFSRTRLGGAKQPAVVWGDLGLRGEWAKRPIHAYSRGPGSASYASIVDKIMLKGEFQSGVLFRDDASALAEAVMTDPAGLAIGTMSSWYFANKVLPLVPLHGEEAVFPTQENVSTSLYPMPRLYSAYLNLKPGGVLPGPVDAVVHFLLSQEGQNAVADSGLLPAPPEAIRSAWKQLSH